MSFRPADQLADDRTDKCHSIGMKAARMPKTRAYFKWRWFFAVACLAAAVGGGLPAGGQTKFEPADSSRAPQRLPFRSVRSEPGSQHTDEAVRADQTAQPQPESAGEATPLRLPKPRESAGRSVKPIGGLHALTTVGSSLAMVVGAFLLVVLALRRAQPKGTRLLPHEVVEVLGRKPLAARTSLQLVRLGSKLVLVAVMPDGVETISELTDPVEVDRLSGLCRQKGPGSITQSFAEILSDSGSDRLGGKGRRR